MDLTFGVTQDLTYQNQNINGLKTRPRSRGLRHRYNVIL